MSLALDHKKRTLAQGVTARAGVAETYTHGSALAGPANAQKHLALLTASLVDDCARLSDLNSHEAKQRLKRDELLPKYLGYVQRYRESGLNHSNPLMMQVMVWLFDIEQFEQALELADFAMAQKQSMPERFRRDIPTFVGDAMVEWAEGEHKAGRSPEPYLSQLLPRVDGEWELFEKIPARYHKLLGILAMESEHWDTACRHFYRAAELYPEIGVNTRMKEASKALRKEEAEAEALARAEAEASNTN